MHLFPSLTVSLIQPSEQELNQKALFFHTLHIKRCYQFLSVTHCLSPATLMCFENTKQGTSSLDLQPLSSVSSKLLSTRGAGLPLHFPRLCAWCWNCTLPNDLAFGSPEGNISTGASKIWKLSTIWLKALIDYCNVSAHGMTVSILGQYWKMQGKNSHWNQEEVTYLIKS